MGETMDDVALGDNAIDALAVIAGDESADIAGDQRVTAAPTVSPGRIVATALPLLCRIVSTFIASLAELWRGPPQRPPESRSA